MALYTLCRCKKCGADLWRLNAVDRDTEVRVTSYSCFYCGRVEPIVQARRVPRGGVE